MRVHLFSTSSLNAHLERHPWRFTYILIRNGNPFCAFPTHLHLQIHMPTSCLSSYLASSAKSALSLFRQIVTLRWNPCRYRTNVYGLSGNTWGDRKTAHESHNDVRRLCWHAGAIFVLLPELGLRKPPSGNPEGLDLLGEGCMHLPASAVVKQSPWIGGNRGSVQRILGREREEKGLPSSLPQGEGGCESRPHFKIVSFAYVYVYPVIFTGRS